MSLLRRNFAATLALASLTFTSVTIGLVPSASAIINGTEISDGALADGAQFGWLVRLEGVGDARCTGSLIDSEWVLTAAHCAGIGFGSDITAFFGPIGSDDGTVVSQTLVHPSYSGDGDSENDLALMRLSAATTRPRVQLAGISDSLVSGTDVQMAGWGLTSTADNAPLVPHEGDSVVTELDSRVVVTGGLAIGCSGDSGGPLLDNGVLVGVISASDAQCAEFTLSTRISAHREWIASIAGAGNLPPIATGGSISAVPGQPVEITLAFSDPDSDSAFISGLQFDQSLWGSGDLECVGVPGAFVCTFTPIIPFIGTTEFTYQVSDNDGATATAKWVVTYSAGPSAPVADNANVPVVVNRPRNIELTASDENGDAITFDIVEQPQNGGLSNCSTGICVYTPNTDYLGSDSFTFTATDSGGLISNIATVTIDVALNAAPEVFDFAFTIVKNTTVDLSLAGFDPNDDALVYTIVSDPANGVLDGCSTGNCTYTPSFDFEGLDSFTYSAADPDGLSSGTATVTIEVTANSAPVADDSSVQTKVGVPVEIILPASDDSDDLTYQIESSPAHGTLDCDGPSCVYMPLTDFSGPDSFTWTASDSSGASDLALVTIEVVGRLWDVTPLDSSNAAGQLVAAVVDGDLTGLGEFRGETSAAGTFSGALDAIGIDSGIVLSSGRVVDVIGPNLSRFQSTVHDGPGAPDLFTGIDSHDVVALEYEVVPSSNQLTFRYVLASDEYSDGGYVFPDFDDTAIISVPDQMCGLPGAAEPLPISINSLRLGTYDGEGQAADDPINTELFIDNQFGVSTFDTEMNGFSRVIECTLNVDAGQPVVVTVAIADGGDGGIDSALFIEGDIITDGGDLIDELRGMTNGLPIATSLAAKIDAVKAAIDSERIASACGVLNALTKEVKAQTGRKIPTAIAADLMATAGRIAVQLGCS